jgi:6-phosphogluconolactonase
MVDPGTRTFEMSDDLITEQCFDSRDAASIAAAEHIEAALSRQLEQHASAALVVGGGTSPVRCFAELADSDLAWPKVQVLLSDERWVSPQDDSSNEKMVRQKLLQNRAVDAQLLPMYDEATSIEERCLTLATAIAGLPNPFACAFLGMGADGHFASLFPDASNLHEGLDVDGESLCLPISTAASPHMRVSLTMAALLKSDNILLLIFGAEKRAVFERAKQDPNAYPVSQLLSQRRVPVHVFWAP